MLALYVRLFFYTFFDENYQIAQNLVPSSYKRGKMLPSLRASLSEKAFMNPEHRGVFKGTYNAIKEKMGETR